MISRICLQVPYPGVSAAFMIGSFTASIAKTDLNASHAIINMITTPTPNPLFDPSVIDALTETALILAQLSLDDETEFDLGGFAYGQSPLVTK